MTAKEFCKRLTKKSGKNRGIIRGTSQDPITVLDPVRDDIRGKIFDIPIHVEWVEFSEVVDFSGCLFEQSLQFNHCKFNAGLRLADAHVRAKCCLRSCVFKGLALQKSLDWGRLQVDGLFDASLVTTEACIDLENFRGGDDVWFDGLNATAAIKTDADRPTPPTAGGDDDIYRRSNRLVGRTLNLKGAEIRKDLCFANVGDRRFESSGMLDLRCKVGGSVMFEGSRIAVVDRASTEGIAISLEGAEIGRSVFMRPGGGQLFECEGEINLRAKVGNSVEMEGVRVSVGKAGSDKAVNLQSAELGHSLYIDGAIFDRAGARIARRSIFRGEISLIQAKIEGAANFYGVIIRVGRDKYGPKLAVDFDRASINRIFFRKQEYRKGSFWDCRILGRIDGLGLECISLNLDCLRLEGTARLQYARIRGRAMLEGVTLKRGIELLHAEIHGDLMMRGARIGGFMRRDDQPAKVKRTRSGRQSEIPKYIAVDARHLRVHGRVLAQKVRTTPCLVDMGPNQTMLRDPEKVDDGTWDFDSASIDGNMMFNDARLRGSLQMEDAVIRGEVNLTKARIHKSLVMRSAMVDGTIFTDETCKDQGPFPSVAETVDLSNARLKQVWINIQPAPSGAAAPAPAIPIPKLVQLNGTFAESLEFRGELPHDAPRIELRDLKFDAIEVGRLNVQPSPGHCISLNWKSWLQRYLVCIGLILITLWWVSPILFMIGHSCM